MHRKHNADDRQKQGLGVLQTHRFQNASHQGTNVGVSQRSLKTYIFFHIYFQKSNVFKLCYVHVTIFTHCFLQIFMNVRMTTRTLCSSVGLQIGRTICRLLGRFIRQKEKMTFMYIYVHMQFTMEDCFYISLCEIHILMHLRKKETNLKVTFITDYFILSI